jgi:hypothetical protein
MDFFFATNPNGCPIHPATYPMVPVTVSLWVATGIRILSLPHSVKAKNAWSYTSTPTQLLVTWDLRELRSSYYLEDRHANLEFRMQLLFVASYKLPPGCQQFISFQTKIIIIEGNIFRKIYCCTED